MYLMRTTPLFGIFLRLRVVNGSAVTEAHSYILKSAKHILLFTCEDLPNQTSANVLEEQTSERRLNETRDFLTRRLYLSTAVSGLFFKTQNSKLKTPAMFQIIISKNSKWHRPFDHLLRVA